MRKEELLAMDIVKELETERSVFYRNDLKITCNRMVEWLQESKLS